MIVHDDSQISKKSKRLLETLIITEITIQYNCERFKQLK